MERNPFSENRFEYDTKHLYYLPESIYRRLEQHRPVYLIGTRGTGKTTFLKSMSWEERATNPNLQNAIKGDPFEKRYIGIYLKFAKEHSNYFKKLMDKLNNDSRLDSLFALFLDLVWIELLIDAIAEIIVDENLNLFTVSVEAEQEFVKDILVEYDQFAISSNKKNIHTLRDLAALTKKIRREIDLDLQLEKKIEDLLVKYRPGSLGGFGQAIAKKCAIFCDHNSHGKGKPWHFKVLIDEAEWFSSQQELIINTMVRISESPIFFVISYVRGREEGNITTTINPSICLSNADRELIYMDEEFDQNKVAYDDFYEGVANLRIKATTGDPKATFNLEKILGKLDINFLIGKMLKDSKKPDICRKWLRLAKELKLNKLWKSDKIGSDQSLFYQAYIYEKTCEKPNNSGAIPDNVRAQIRKKMVAAYLNMCKYELGRNNVLYAYSNMVLNLADNCIRDYLLLLSEIYIESGKDLKSFINTAKPISIEKQSIAIKRASEKRYDKIFNSEVRNPQNISKLLLGLGYITAELQSNDDALKTPEKGLYEVSFSDDKEHQRILGDINEASESGYIKIVETIGDKRVFRLHTLLAPKFQFSYRKPYSKVTGLSCKELSKIIKSELSQIENMAKKIAINLSSSKEAKEITLFDCMDED